MLLLEGVVSLPTSLFYTKTARKLWGSFGDCSAERRPDSMASFFWVRRGVKNRIRMDLLRRKGLDVVGSFVEKGQLGRQTQKDHS